MNILICLDSFKGSISSRNANAALAKGLRNILPSGNVKQIELADGGEGTLDALKNQLNKIEYIKTKNVFMEDIECPVGIGENFILIESAQVIGLGQIDLPDAYKATSYGLGLLIKKLLAYNIDNISIGLGGSAINDLGVGMLYALGMKFYNDGKSFLPLGIEGIEKIDFIDISGLDERIFNKKFSLITDVTNPLLGNFGSTHVFGLQKCLKSDDLNRVDKLIERLANFIKVLNGHDSRNEKGAGAAGGLGYTFMTLFNAKFYLGIDWMIDKLEIESEIEKSDIVITGEGSMDMQSLYGKAPIGILNICKNKKKRCFAVCGQNKMEYDPFEKTFSIADITSVEEGISNPEKYLQIIGQDLVKVLNS